MDLSKYSFVISSRKNLINRVPPTKNRDAKDESSGVLFSLSASIFAIFLVKWAVYSVVFRLTH